MRLGILSDTHDEYDWMKLAIATLKRRGAGFVVHCGDLSSARMLELFDVRADQSAAAFIFGNADDDLAAMERRAIALGVACLDDTRQFQMAGKQFAIVHGDNLAELHEAISGQKFDYVLCGHTHIWRDERIGRTRIINPGPAAVLKERSPLRPATCALLHIDTDNLEQIALELSSPWTIYAENK